MKRLRRTLLGWTAALGLACLAGCAPEAEPAGAAVADAAVAGDAAVAACSVPSAPLGPVQKVSALALALDATGCDRDGDGTPDNALGTGLAQIGGTFNARLADDLASGKTVILLAAADFHSDGEVFSLDLLSGALAPQDLECPPTASDADCGYQVLPVSYRRDAPGAVCPPASRLSNARVEQGVLRAGGPGDTLVMPLPGAQFALELKLLDVRLSGSVTWATSASGAQTWLSTQDAVLCGVLTKAGLFAAIDALDDAAVAARGFSKPVLKATLSSFLVPDRAVGGAVANAYSATIRLASVPGHLVP